jgi:hypothetical protein
MKASARSGLPAQRGSNGATRASAALAVVLPIAVAFSACGGAPPPKAVSTSVHAESCGRDQTREYFCEDLLPLATSMPAPSPYEACPSSIEDPASEYDPPPPFGVFDTGYTEYTRKRAPPGHSCCYSWCDKVKLADPSSPAIRQACQTATAFREEFCMAEPEQGTSDPAGAPYDRCPAAIVPPAKRVFSTPVAAALDAQSTATHRARGQADCCYAWCSQAPPGSGILQRHAGK